MSIEIQCMTEKLIVITIKLNYSKVPRKSTCPPMRMERFFTGATKDLATTKRRKHWSPLVKHLIQTTVP